MINEELLDVSSSAVIVRLMKSMRRGWVGCVAHIGEREMHTGFLWGNLKERVLLENSWLSCEDNI
jgi:hypothetical protein